MRDANFKIVNYSEKSVALLIERDGVLTEDLYEIGGKFNFRLSCGPAWIFSRKKSFEALRALLEADGIEYDIIDLDDLPAKRGRRTEGEKNDLPGYILTDNERRAWAQSMGDEDYYKWYNVAIRLSDGEIAAIQKPDLKTEFWHHDEGAGYEEHERITETAQSMREYFIGENTDNFRELIADFINPGAGRDHYKYLWLGNWHKDGRNQWSLKWLDIPPESTNCREALGWHDSELQSMYDEGRFKPLSDDDRRRLLAGYKIALEAMEKRCNAYLKRYGVERLSFRTYWADR